MRRQKVLHLITHLGFGGAQDNTLATVERHDRARFEVHLAAGRDYDDWVPRGRRAADAYFDIDGLRRDPTPGADLRLVTRLAAFLREQRYDVVHTHSAKAGTIGRMAARRARVPVVIHTFHSFGWQAETHDGRRSLRTVVSAGKKWSYVQVERFAASLSDALITVCDRNRKQAIDLRLAPPEKLITIYSGIDLESYVSRRTRAEVRKELGLDLDRPVVGSVGRFAPQKAPLDLVEAARRVLTRRPDAQFVMVGAGPLEHEVRAAIDDDARIRVLGYRDDVPDMLAAFDVFMQASLWEGLGRAATEAMIMRLPVAATAVDGVPELVLDGETGLLSPPGSPAALARNVTWLLDHPDDARAMGRRGRERVVPAFDVRAMVTSIEELYTRELASKGLLTAVAA